MTALAQALAKGSLGNRLWLYSNYHCNLTCTYCLTESGPLVSRRELDPDTMVDLAHEARALGFTQLGITGGEPFLIPHMPELLLELSRVLPVLVLTNGTLFRRALLDRMAPLADADVTLQISLDHPDPVANDVMRGPQNFRKVVDAVPALLRHGIGVRIATTVEDPDADDLARLCALHRNLGITDDDHIVRPILRRGRARTGDMGVVARYLDLPPELTVTADGAFWSPFGPTVTGGVLDTDLLLTRTVRPLQRPVQAMLTVLGARPEGADSTLNIR
ncbi:4Fe-4S single cluster domain-containing protein [Modestobacter sp. DSM 44400]|uniref:radical SAM protein n=1 Tax=Modestobacter sp. DSM 44400 TaxID=1550230 RepID=UPI0008979D1D|nr:radical SAM protein [Modestobacter sp. DSM 44400]SDX71795.1 4Fe-4S single cluster domain-containing protein [Modestobacter sp. DSM 44400]